MIRGQFNLDGSIEITKFIQVSRIRVMAYALLILFREK